MYELEEISRDGDIVTAKMIPMKEIHRYENGKHIIEYVSSKENMYEGIDGEWHYKDW